MSNGVMNAGRFQTGNKGNPSARGRPRRPPAQRYAAAAVSVVNLSAWQTLVRKQLARALGGDGQAAEWLRLVLVGGGEPLPAGVKVPVREPAEAAPI